MMRAGFHKGAAFVIFFGLVAFGSTEALAQDDQALERVQAVIGELRTARQAHEVDQMLRDQPGVRMSRTDYNTRNLLLEVSPDHGLTEQSLADLLAPFGLTVRCYTRLADPAAPFVLLDPRTCLNNPVAR